MEILNGQPRCQDGAGDEHGEEPGQLNELIDVVMESLRRAKRLRVGTCELEEH